MEVAGRDLAQLKGMIVVQKGKIAFKSAPICTQLKVNEPAQGKGRWTSFLICRCS